MYRALFGSVHVACMVVYAVGLLFGLSMLVVCFRVAENELFDYSDLNVSMAIWLLSATCGKITESPNTIQLVV